MFQPTLQFTNKFIGILTLSLLEAMRFINKDGLAGHTYIENTLENLRKIVWNALPITTLTISAISIIYSIHIAPDFAVRGLNLYFGGIVALALIREGVPVMGALAIITHYATGITAQIGSMKATEQIDAMKISKVSPVAYLLVPMIIAAVIGFPILISIGIFVGLVVSFISTSILIDLNLTLFTTSILQAIVIKDVFLAIVKAIVFGFVVSLISYTCGITTGYGAKAVGDSTKLSVVINFTLVIILDYLITALWL